MMKAETFMSADEAKDWGLIDEIIPIRSMAAKFDPAKFGNNPKALAWLRDREREAGDAERKARVLARGELLKARAG